MGLGYFFLFVMILGAGAAAVSLLKTAWEIWKKPRIKIFAIIPLLFAGFCAAAALYFLVIVWRDPPWAFRF